MVRCKFHLVLILFGLKSERTSWKSDGDFVVMLWLKKKMLFRAISRELGRS